MQRVISGGTTHIMGGRVDTFTKREKKWMELDPKRITAAMAGAATRREQLSRLIKMSEIAGDMTQFMRKTHQALCEFFIRRIESRVGQVEIGSTRPDVMGFHVVDDASPGDNYTREMHLLKNMRFEGWEPNGSLKFLGFCRLEPQARLLQLIEFPIERFGVDEMPQIAWPEPPALRDRLVDFGVPNAIAEFIPELHEWEQYYIQLAKAMVTLREKLAD